MEQATVERAATNFLLAGVGGQGILLAADVVAEVGMEMGLDAKKSEIHGMAQRGGSVTSQVRWGQRVFSPMIMPGEVDYLIAFERLEALRYVEMLRPGGAVLISDYRISPVSVTSGGDSYPVPADEEKSYAGISHLYVPAIAMAQGLGNARVNNVVMLGVLAAVLERPDPASRGVAPLRGAMPWLDVIASRVPERFVALNQQAFALGKSYAQERLERPLGSLGD